MHFTISISEYNIDLFCCQMVLLSGGKGPISISEKPGHDQFQKVNKKEKKKKILIQNVPQEGKEEKECCYCDAIIGVNVHVFVRTFKYLM